MAIGDDSSNGTIKVYNESGELVFSFKAHESQINGIKQLPNGFVATVSSDNTSKIWNSITFDLIQTYTGHTQPVYGLEYIDEYTIATGALSPDMTIRLWSICTSNTNRTIHTGSGIMSLKLLSNGVYLASALVSHFINIYNIYTGNLVSVLTGHSYGVNCLVLINNDLLASSSNDKTILIWNLTTNSSKFNMTGHTQNVLGLKLITSDILSSGSSDGTIKLWNITNGTLIRTLYGHTNKVYWSIDFLNDGQTLISGSLDQTAKIWNYNTGYLVRTINTSLNIRSLTTFSEIYGKLIFFKFEIYIYSFFSDH